MVTVVIVNLTLLQHPFKHGCLHHFVVPMDVIIVLTVSAGGLIFLKTFMNVLLMVIVAELPLLIRKYLNLNLNCLILKVSLRKHKKI